MKFDVLETLSEQGPLEARRQGPARTALFVLTLVEKARRGVTLVESKHKERFEKALAHSHSQQQYRLTVRSLLVPNSSRGFQIPRDASLVAVSL